MGPPTPYLVLLAGGSTSPPTSLQEALAARFVAAGLDAPGKITGGFFHRKAKKKPTPPYATFEVSGSGSAMESVEGVWENQRITLRVFHTDEDEAIDLGKSLRAAFYDQAFVWDGGQCSPLAGTGAAGQRPGKLGKTDSDTLYVASTELKCVVFGSL